MLRATARGVRDDSRLESALTTATRNLRVGIRRALTAVETQQRLAPSLPALLDELADAVERHAEPELALPRSSTSAGDWTPRRSVPVRWPTS